MCDFAHAQTLQLSDIEESRKFLLSLSEAGCRDKKCSVALARRERVLQIKGKKTLGEEWTKKVEKDGTEVQHAAL